jgi:hypothetical protein
VESFVAVYVDRSAQPRDVEEAVAQLAVPAGVTNVVVDFSVSTETFDCRIAVDLSGNFDRAEGERIARCYAEDLRGVLGVAVYCLADLMSREYFPS